MTAHHRPEPAPAPVPDPRRAAAPAPPAPAPPASAPVPAPPDHFAPADGAVLGSWLEPDRVKVLAAEWRAVQVGFVDDPADAVERADDLVGRVAGEVGDAVRARREALQGAPGPADGAPADTERLRRVLRDYRSLLDRLLAA